MRGQAHLADRLEHALDLFGSCMAVHDNEHGVSSRTRAAIARWYRHLKPRGHNEPSNRCRIILLLEASQGKRLRSRAESGVWRLAQAARQC
jgi:hypothetical protein